MCDGKKVVQSAFCFGELAILESLESLEPLESLETLENLEPLAIKKNARYVEKAVAGGSLVVGTVFCQFHWSGGSV